MKRIIIWVHRYLGIPLSLVFVVWFVSGIVMMYADSLPALTPAQRLERMPELDLASVTLSPAQAFERADFGDTITLRSVLGRPAYVFSGGFGPPTTVFADDGKILQRLDRDTTRRVAADFLAIPMDRVGFAGTITEPDQWTLTQMRNLPLDKFEVDDEAGTTIYVSPASGEVAVVTTRTSRMLAWFGAIPHWFYFTPLRVNQPLWYWTVVYVAAIGCVLALLGLVLAVTQFRPSRPFNLGRSIPYRSWLRWHYITGTVFGIFTLTWVFSGLMSMEPFAWTRANGLYVPQDAMSGGPTDLRQFATPDRAGLAAALAGRSLKEIDFTTFAGEPYYVARASVSVADEARSERSHQPYPLTFGRDGDELLISARSGQVRTEPFATDHISRTLQAAVPDASIIDATLLNDYDAYYYARNGSAPLPVVRMKFDDPASTWVYVDAWRSQIVSVSHRLSRLERWLFNGLHSLDFSFWYDRRPLWDIGMIVLSLGALASSGIGAYLGIKRLRRDLRRAGIARPSSTESRA